MYTIIVPITIDDMPRLVRHDLPSADEAASWISEHTERRVSAVLLFSLSPGEIKEYRGADGFTVAIVIKA